MKLVWTIPPFDWDWPHDNSIVFDLLESSSNLGEFVDHVVEELVQPPQSADWEAFAVQLQAHLAHPVGGCVFLGGFEIARFAPNRRRGPNAFGSACPVYATYLGQTLFSALAEMWHG